ncbi:ectoine/hydroxyectoine ABC transporter ATP-binding protein EhuA [Sporolactobacillus shoreicorticis]|uniref:Ectoine/hydroxyectoine ABC transporter ATP-binding protein EhuA n=1 Tax=Sporolactobacillus shoreicorticis TaxID=1923877 RepID=A0ABW5S3P4_9BACL|nr:ectoine/hydroxyectoine ABC transporter ATP-binding protein EhuA [Sporolactobacillus shoreicorticis]
MPRTSDASLLNQEPYVKYRNIGMKFGDTEVMKGINFDILSGEKVAMIGPSGSGKTTLARMLMTLEKPTEGTIEIGGKLLWHRRANGKLVDANLKHLRQVRGQIGMVFQQYNLFPHMTILRNVMEAQVHVLGLTKKEAEDRARKILKKVGLEHKCDAYPAQLSGGQQQRVAMARAVVMKPKIMLFDEVTSALDPELVGEVLEVIREIAEEDEMAMLLITHEMAFARDIADRVVFMADGQIIEQGPPEQIFNYPQHQRTKNFLSRFSTEFH